MRDFQLPGRSPVHAGHGMAATSHPLATSTALDVLRAGGNAVDAAVAAGAVLSVVEPQSTGIGGDCFVLYAPRGGPDIVAFNGSGRAPAAAEPAWFLDRGIRAIEPESPHAVTVPGAVDAWARLVADHGGKGLDALLQPAIALAENGSPVHARVAHDWTACVDKLKADPTTRRIFLRQGRAPAAGSLHRQPKLAETLRRIAEEGRDGFYLGPVAEDIVGYLEGLGGLMSLDDFAAAEGEYVTPIHTAYRGVDVYECPPNGQGIVALMMFNVLSGFALGNLDPLGSERLHLEVEAGRLAFRDRDALIGDPAEVEVPVERLLSADYAASMRELVRPDRAMASLPPAGLRGRGDTVYLCVVDGELNAVSFINSLFDHFGSGLTSPRTGVLLHSRGASFRIDPDHPNGIAPRKRPLHTIIPAMAVKDGRVLMPFGVLGADYQPFGQVHFLSNVLDFGLDVQAALDLARVFHDGAAVVVERGVSDETAAALAALGHEVRRAEKPLGGGQSIHIDWETGVMTGGSDPRKDGCALGY